MGQLGFSECVGWLHVGLNRMLAVKNESETVFNVSVCRFGYSIRLILSFFRIL